MRPHLFTAGHGARPVEAFLAVLAEVPVGLLVDIRRYPGSRRHPQFGRDALAASLAAQGIGYEWWGETLGGRRARSAASRHTALRTPCPGPQRTAGARRRRTWRMAAFGGYADHMDSNAFRDAVEALLARAASVRLAIMCAETVWWRCHRMLVADALGLRGATVTHPLEAGRRQPHRLHPAVRPGDDGWPVYDVSDALPGL